MNQIELHKKIDILLLKDPDSVKRKEVSDLISANKDACQYFYTKADERWLSWLWENGFLDVIKQKAEDQTRYGYRTPELNFLVRVAEKIPSKVVNIMLAIPVSAGTFNPEVVDRFLWICGTLPADQLARVVPKIHDERWIPLMGVFNRWGFEYEKMLKTLAGTKDYKNLLILAEAILEVRDKKEIERKNNHVAIDNPFYFDNLSHTKVFEYLISIGSEYTEKALELTTKAMARVVLLGGETQDTGIFPIEETFHLFDVDFFSLEPIQKERPSHRDDVRELAAVIKVFANRLIGEKCAKVDTIRTIYKKHIESLPRSRTMWRLRLFVLSLCPEAFKEELRNSFFRLFKVERYHEIISGTEYEKALQKGFSVLSDDDKREYVKQVIEYFTKHAEDKEDQDWHIRYGSRIISMIEGQLTPAEKQEAEQAGFRLDPNYEPEPSIGPMRAGTVRPKGPISQDEFNKLPVVEIAKKLRNEWTPEKLSKQNKGDDFLNPLNAEGVGKLLRVDIAKRLQNYISNAPQFFERDVLDQHYTYSFLRGIQEAIKNDKESVTKINCDNLIALCISIKESGEAKPYDRKARKRDTFDAWLVNWTAVHSAITDVVQGLLSEKNGDIVIDFSKYHDQLFAIISYLLSYSDPTPEDEKIESAKMKTKSSGDEEYLVSDPFSMAINTVRGRAFQALTLFVYQDGKKFSKNKAVKIDSDIKKLYETVLKNENTRALMFMFGHYLPSFYYRDKEWIKGLLPQIFPKESEKKHLYTAAWEGYLANDLYEEMFFDSDIKKLYERGLNLTDAEYPKQKHPKDPDEGIAVHFALAFMYYENFGFNHSLFQTFWAIDNTKRHAGFVSFLGRSFVSSDNAKSNELLKKEPRSKQRLKDFWDWMLKHYKNTKPFIKFGFWINLEKDIFEPVWLAEHIKKTLEKTKGGLDWDYGLIKSIIQIAKESPKDTLAIARLYLFEGGVRGDNIRMPFRVDDEWFKALQVLYDKQITKKDTEKLIDDLIREGGSIFWKLKEILNES